MKKKLLLGLGVILISNTAIQAQNWVNGGNSLSSSGKIGTNSNHSLLFETYNLERGRITNSGLWGIGTTAPNAKLHVNSITNQDPLRVQINNSTKLLVHRGGGVSIGVANVPPANGLLVGGTVGIGTTTPSTNNKLEVVNTATESTGISGVGSHTGVHGEGNTWGVEGTSEFIGVLGHSENGNGVWGSSANGTGITGYSDYSGTGGTFMSYGGTGIIAQSLNGSWAAELYGDVAIDGNLYTYNTFNTSDANLKKNIQEFNNATSIINKLKPKYYQFKDDDQYATLHLPKGNHYGLLAQDVEAVLPNLVKESTLEIRDHKSIAAIKSSVNGKSVLLSIKNEQKENIKIKAVNYTELIPIVIKGMQEQQQTIQEQAQIIQKQQQEIDEFKERFAKLEAALSSGKNGLTGSLISAGMLQNFPNPVRETTTFNYSIAKGASGKILVYDASGKLVRSLAAPDSGQVQMNANGLSAGKYTATLLVDGKVITSNHILVE